MRRSMAVVAAVLCVCTLAVCGCGSSAVTASTQTTAAQEVVGLYPVSVDGKWGYIDQTGAIRIQPRFDHADGFSDALAMVGVVEGGMQKCGYIDPSGALVIQPQFEAAGPFSDGMAAVGTVGTDSAEDFRYGYIDKTGAVVIPIQYQGFVRGAPKFSNGLCVVAVEDDGPPPSVTSTSLVVESNSRHYGYMDKTGSIVIDAQFGLAGEFSEGLAMVGSDSGWGFIDTRGEWVIRLPSEFSPGRLSDCRFSEGLAIVRRFDPPSESGAPSAGNAGRAPYGFIDTAGKLIIEARFDRAMDFSEGLAAVGITENDVTTWGYIDTTGAWAIEPQFDAAWPFAEGLAPVGLRVSGDPSGDTRITDYDCGYIDTTGRLVIPAQYQVAGEFSGGVARVETWATVEGPAGFARISTAYIDATGKVIWQGE
jgi:hypothetical protein